MANYTIVLDCDHKAQVKVRGATPSRERTLDRERKHICRRCAIEKQRSQVEIAANAEELPALMGAAQTDSPGYENPSQGSCGGGDILGLPP